MIYLLLSILSSTVIFVIFRLFKKFEINTLQAIIFNYFVACAVGLTWFIPNPDLRVIPQKNWFLGVIILGFLFIAVFNLAAITTQRSGLSVVAVASKMSVAIPVLFGIFLYQESTGLGKIFGIILALFAVYLSSIKTNKGLNIQPKNLIFPLLVFFGSGIIDTSIKYLEANYVANEDVGLFSSAIFAFAGITGISILTIQAFSNKLKFQWKNVMGGIVLGIPNYFSIYFLVMALRNPDFESSTLFTLNNVAIVTLSTLLGIALFRERLIKHNWIGLALAVISIILVARSAV